MSVEEKSTALAPKNLSIDELILGGENQDLSALTMPERIELFARLSAAQAATGIDDRFLNKSLVVIGMTVYERPFQNPDTGFMEVARYVTFNLDGDESIRTASSQAIPFAIQTARMLGYDPKTGQLPIRMLMKIVPQKAETGFIYRFVFEGEAPAAKK